MLGENDVHQGDDVVRGRLNPGITGDVGSVCDEGHRQQCESCQQAPTVHRWAPTDWITLLSPRTPDAALCRALPGCGRSRRPLPAPAGDEIVQGLQFPK